MMKAVLIVLGSLGALYAAAGIVQLVGVLLHVRAGTTYGGAVIAASVVPVCLGLAVCLFCFQRAFRKRRQS